MPETAHPRVLVLACGALTREILDIVRCNRWAHVTVESLPADLHNRPERIPDAVAARLEARRDQYDSILVGYTDCGTGGHLDAVVEEYGAVRLPGAHCYEFFSTAPVFAAIAGDEIGTFYLTDYLARHFDRIVWEGLGLDRHPELLDAYFGNYTRVAYLSQRATPDLIARSEAAAERLGLDFEHRPVGYGDLEPALRNVALRRGDQLLPMPVPVAS
jgi:hypothetical protein